MKTIVPASHLDRLSFDSTCRLSYEKLLYQQVNPDRLVLEEGDNEGE